MLFFASLLVSSWLVAVTHGAAVADECQMLEEKPGPRCCQHQKEKGDKEKEAEMAKNMQQCLREYRDGLPGPPRGDDSKLSLMECVSECFFNYSRLLTPDMKLNKEMIMKIDDNHEENPHWKMVDAAAMDTCFAKHGAGGRPNARCKSGSFQLIRCLMRERFFNCPKEEWTENQQCAAYRSSLQKCTDVVPHLHED